MYLNQAGQKALMQIFSSDRSSFIRMNLQALQEAPFPSRQFSVSLQCHSFAATVDAIWIELLVLEQFLRELQEVASNRREITALISMSPNEFRLQVEAVPPRGHLLVKARLAYPVYLRDQIFSHQVEGGFELDASELASFIVQLRKEAKILNIYN